MRLERLSIMVSAILLLTGLAATTVSAQERLKVVTTFTILQDMAQNVAGSESDGERTAAS